MVNNLARNSIHLQALGQMMQRLCRHSQWCRRGYASEIL